MTSRPRAHVVGVGLIGGSIALALRRAGWEVSGEDLDEANLNRALTAGVISGTSSDNANLYFIATPSQTVPAVAMQILERNPSRDLIVTDVAGVKDSIVTSVTDARFIGGHPMAGSEMKGLDGSREDLFETATWVLTPTENTPTQAYAHLHSIISSLGASPLAISASNHDRLVAMASHVPHLVAGALMNEAAKMAESDSILLRLAAGGFRDMTRISAGEPEIWPNVLFDNRSAVVDGLDKLMERLQRIRDVVAQQDKASLMEELTTASVARRELPGRASVARDLVFVRIPISDQPGMLAIITNLASDMDVNIFDIEIAHGVEGTSGVLELSIERDDAPQLMVALKGAGFHTSIRPS